jgi:hypothetical protein
MHTIKGKTSKSWRRKAKGLKSSNNTDGQDCRAAEKSKTSESWRHKAQALKLLYNSQERPAAEKQNQGNLATQSHGSKVRVLRKISTDHDCQTAEKCRSPAVNGNIHGWCFYLFIRPVAAR